METVSNTVKEEIKEYLVNEFFGGDSTDVDYSTKLVSSGLLDSISTMQVISHIEDKYKVEFFPQEMTPEYIDTIDLLANCVHQKSK